MSTDTENVGEGTDTSALTALEDWYHIPVLGAVMLFMIWVRTQAYETVAMADGNARLAAVDSWYHWRTVQWTAENYPYTMPYDIWTSFPTGRYVGQFGTLFDQILVTAAMIVGLGDPSTETLYTVSLFMVPVLAALVAIPVFYMGRRLGGTLGGIVSVLILALLPGRFLAQSTIGQLQHHVAEVLFMGIAVLAMMVALRAAEREQPVYELLVDKDWTTLRNPTIYSVLAGIALTLYIWVWPPAVVLVGIFAVFFTVQLCLDYVRGRSPEHIAFVGAVSLGTAALLTALLIEEPGTSVTSFSYIQPLSAALVAGGCVFMAWFARQWNQRGLERRYYPGAIAGLIAATFLVMWLVLPDLFSTLVDNATRRVVPFADAGTDATIQEAQSPPNFATHVFTQTGATFFTMLLGIGLLLARPFFDREYRTEHTLVIVWALFLTSMAATQVRFAYYLVLPVAVINAAFVADIIRLFDFDISTGANSFRDIEGYQAIAGLLIVLVLFVPLLTSMGGATAMDRGSVTGVSDHPMEDSLIWEDSNQWLAENTPEQGDWGGADNASQLDLYGSYEYPEGENYDYPVGSYGIMSWWDYGHLITTQGERAPHSNPFQSGATSSSAFLTAESEERGELVLDAISADESPGDASDDELEAMAENATHEEMRYVMIDDQMAGGKFTAISQWTEPPMETYFDDQNVLVEENEMALPAGNDNYHDTMVASLYLDDADGLEHYRLVHESDRFSIVGAGVQVDQTTGQVAPQPSTSDRFQQGSWDDIEEAAAQIEMASQTNQAIPLGDGYYHNAQVTSSLKTFERVEGATLTGSVDDDELANDDATVTAAVDLETETDRPFTYTQEVDLEDDGTFELTVPYATNDERGVDDGYTNSSVAAMDDYEITVSADEDDETLVYYEGQTDVPESAVLDGEDLEVTLEEVDDPEEADEPEAEDEVDEEDADEDDLDDLEDVDEDETVDEEDETDTEPALEPIAPRP